MPTLTTQQVQELRNRGLKDDAIARTAAVRGYSLPPEMQQQLSTQGEQVSRFEQFQDVATGVGTGFLKRTGSTLQNIGNIIAKPLGKAFGVPEEQIGIREELLQPEGTAERVGGLVADVASFALPSNVATKATAGANLLARSLGQAFAAGASSAVQEGKIDSGTAQSAALGAVIPSSEKAFSALSNAITKSVPRWLVTSLLKQSKDAKRKGKDITDFLLDKGTVGSVNKLVTQAEDDIVKVNSTIQNALKQSDELVDVVSVRQSVADAVNAAGGAIGIDDVDDIVLRLAPQGAGLLRQQQLSLVDANKLRSAIDKTLGDRGFLKDQIPFNKDVLRQFTNTLRETVKEKAPEGTRQAFDELAKNITLKNALLDRELSGGGKLGVGLVDVITGLGGFAATGDIEQAVGLALGRRAFESSVFKTGLAQAFKSPEKLAPLVQKLAPAERAFFFEVLDSAISRE